MNKLTTDQKLTEVERMRQCIIESAKENIAKYMEQAQKDFCYFFHWNAEHMYRAQMKFDYFSEMNPITTHNDIELLIKAFEKRISNIEHELINTSAFGSCTNEVVNLEHRLKLTGKQVIREKLQEMKWILED